MMPKKRVISEELKHRDRRIYELRLQGWTLEKIGRLFKITRERVRQICWLQERKQQQGGVDG